jgi:hypothetical protein
LLYPLRIPDNVSQWAGGGVLSSRGDNSQTPPPPGEIAVSKPKDCPGDAELELFYLGHLSADEDGEIADHVAQCPRCLGELGALDAQDSLVDALRGAEAGSADKDRGEVERLVARLRVAVSAAAASTPHPPDAHRPILRPPKFKLTCPGCGRQLRVRTELAGKRGKCPACKSPFRIPMGLSPAAEAETVAPVPAGDNTPPGASAQVPAVATGRIGRELYDFLTPPEQLDEIGRLGNYRVLKVLGAGGMGVVFQAEDPALGRKVALKTMLPSLADGGIARQRFLREARTAAAIEHDNIVPIFHVGEERGVPFIAMPLLKGEPLDERLRREPVLPIADVLRIGREAARGLAAAHAAGLIHRDIKPANLWLEGSEGRVKILDFGLARAATEGAHVTQTGDIVGTPAYMSPEQADGQPLDGRSDLFSLGCVLFRSCTGLPPFDGNDMISVIMAVATEHPPPPKEVNSAVPAALSNLIMRLLAKSPAQRPASGEEVATEIAIIEQTLARQRVSRLPPWIVRAGRDWRFWAVMAGIAATLLIAVGVVIRFRHKESAVTEVKVPAATTIEIDPVAEPVTHPPADSSVQQIPPQFPAETFEKWLVDTMKLPPEPCVQAIAARLKELNPGFSGTVGCTVWKPSSQVDISFCTDGVTDISPLRAIALLPRPHVSMNGSAPGKGSLADLSPLSGLPIVYLEVRGNPVRDLTPLQGLPLEQLYITDVQVANLTPLLMIRSLKTLHFSTNVFADLWPIWQSSLWLRELADTPTANFLTRVRSFYSLKQINNQDVLEFWEKHDPKHAEFLRWIEQTKKLDVVQKIDAIKAKFKERNPEFRDELQTKVRNGAITDLSFLSDHVEDIAPIRAFSRLKTLTCSGNWPFKGKLGDLSPLQGMSLQYLDCRDNPDVRDLSPLRFLPLTDLHFGDTNIKDLSPIRDLRLNYFECYYSQVDSLSALKGMPLVHLNASGCRQVHDLSPLRGMSLEGLSIKQTAVNDLTPLEGMPLRDLECNLMRAPDFAPLRKTPIERILCDAPEKQTSTLSHLWTLKNINGEGTSEFFQKNNPSRAAFLQWVKDTSLLPPERQVEAVKSKLKEFNPELDVSQVGAGIVEQKVIALSIPAATVTDLSPVRALPELRTLRCPGPSNRRGKLSDLAPLESLTHLQQLYISLTDVADLAQLQRLRLTFLHCDATAIQDLSPIKQMPLQELRCDPELANSNRDMLQSIKSLQTINDKPAAEFWKELRAKES